MNPFLKNIETFPFTQTLHRSERRIILTWFDDLEIDVPEAAAAAEEMAGCEYIMSDFAVSIYKMKANFETANQDEVIASQFGF